MKTRAATIGYFAAWQTPGRKAAAIVEQIRAYGINGAARQITANSAMFYMIKYEQEREANK
jgi:hypothetical protein